MTHSTTFGSSLVIRLAVKVFPLRTPHDFELLDIAALRKKYLKRSLAEIFAFLLIAPFVVQALQARLLAYSQEYKPPASAIYALTPYAGFWYVPAAFLGVVLTCVLIHIGNRLSLPDGGREYRYSSDANTGFAASKLFLTMGLLVAAAGSAMAFDAARSHLVMTPTDLIFQRMWSSQEEQHPYSDITAIKEVTDKDGQSSEFRIEFINGEAWTTAAEEIFPEPAHKAFLEQAAGKQIEVVSK